jgi:hypothetical protein
MLSKAYGGEAVKKLSVFEWHKRFKEGFKNVGDVKIAMKTMLTTFFNIKGIVHFEFIPQGQTVNQTFYVETEAVM